MNWFEILVVAGIFINVLPLYCILLDIGEILSKVKKATR